MSWPDYLLGDDVPPEPEFKPDDAAVVWFVRKAKPTGPLCTFAAVKAADRWYLTGRSGQNYEWPALYEWINQYGPVAIFVGTQWTAL